MKQISLLILVVGFVFPGLISGDTLKVTMGPKQPKILSVEECKKIAEEVYNSHLNISKVIAPDEYQLQKGASIANWAVYLGADDLPYVVEFLFRRKPDNVGVFTVVVNMREGAALGGNAITPQDIKKNPSAQCLLAVDYLQQWFDTLRTLGYKVDTNTPFKAYFFEPIYPCFFVVYELNRDGKTEELIIDPLLGIFPSKYHNVPSWVKTIKDMKEYVQQYKEELEKKRKQFNKLDTGNRWSPPSGHWVYEVPNVPEYSMSWLGYKCAATACTDVMMYWDHTLEGWLDNSDEHTYARDFAEYWGTQGEAPADKIAPAIKKVGCDHGEDFKTLNGEVKENSSEAEGYRYLGSLTQELGEQRPLVLVDFWHNHAHCCYGIEGEGNDKTTWFYLNYDGYDPPQWEPLRVWRSSIGWRPAMFISGYPISKYPTVVYTDPPRGAEGVDIDYQVKITFSKKMNTESVESGITINPDYDREYQWSEDQRVVTIIIKNPEKDLEFLTEYQITIAGSVEDITGKTLDGNKNGKPEGSLEDV